MTRHGQFSRRQILVGGITAAATGMLARNRPAWAGEDSDFAPRPGAWRTFEMVTRIALRDTRGGAQAWVPVPSFTGAAWMEPLSDTWSTNAAEAQLVAVPASGLQVVHARWADGDPAPVLEVTSRVRTRDRACDLDAPTSQAVLPPDKVAQYTAATELQPTDGIVAETAARITAGLQTDLQKTRALYEWVVDNTFRDPKTRGCGIGDIASLLKSGNLGGKCADLNALFVTLARASGIPARDIYGLRVAPSRFGYKSLGPSTENVTKAQHCRAEVYLAGFGWVPADPADVRKVVLEEPPGNLPLDAAKVRAARKTLLGAWETNWIALNSGHDVKLPGSRHQVPFLMYPQAEVGGTLIDSLAPDDFKYTITAREVAS